jgi:hypothetical protein
MLRTALTLASRGIHVFPCVPRGKVPACEHGCKDATINADIIRQWWRTEPTYNVGIATGAQSGVFAIDIDGGNAEAQLARLEAQHGALPPTVEVITGRAEGGRHLYFRYPHDRPVGNSAGRVGPHIDIRGDGGYTLAPPSVHPGGRAYAWSTDSARTFAPAPIWLLDRVTGPAERKQRTPPAEWRTVISGVDEGQRNNTIARLCGYLLRRRCDLVVTLRLLQSWNSACCRPPLPAEDVERIVTSISNKEEKRRRSPDDRR